MKKTASTLLLFSLSLYAAKEGSLALYVLKDGAPVTKQRFEIFALSDQNLSQLKPIKIIVTDKDGAAFAKLKAGRYIVVGHLSKPQAYVKKPFAIAPKKETQIILLFRDNKLALEDVEAPKSIKNINVTKKKLLTGTLSLKVISSESKKAVKGAKIFVSGMRIDATTNAKGLASLQIPEGNQTISIIHPDYSSQTIHVSIHPKEMLTKVVELTPAAMELEEFVVLAPHVEGSIAAVMAEEKQSESIANILGAEQISKQGDSNAASALKRVAGVTLIGGKTIYIRGLGDRYSCTELNSMALPSPNPLKRTVPLDMFPSSIIGSLQVQKSPSPDIPATWGGGYVNIRTKKGSHQDFLKIKIGLSMHSSTGKKATSYKGPSNEWTGYSDGSLAFDGKVYEALSPVIGERKPDITEYVKDSKMLQDLLTKRPISTTKKEVPYGKEILMAGEKNFDLGDHEISISGNYGYKQKSNLVSYHNYDYIISSDGTQDDTPDNISINNLFRTSIQHGGILNISYKYKDALDAKFTKLYVLNTRKQTRDINGTFGENNSREHRYFLEWQERELDINQLHIGSNYKIAKYKSRIDLGLEKATASEYVPNDVYYNYKQYFKKQPYVFAGNDSILRYTHRSTEDKVTNVLLKNKTYMNLFDEEDYLEAGLFVEKKDREGRLTKIRVQNNLNPRNPIAAGSIDEILAYGSGDHLTAALESQPKDQYDASLDRKAYFLKLMLHPTADLSVMLGARFADVKQSVDQLGVKANIITSEQHELSFTKLLPSLTLKYMLNDTNQIRFAYGKTFIYPDFREFINTEFIHPVFLAKISGNPNLKETDITGYDLRYDHYFGDIDNINITLFYKSLLHPIEDTREFTTSTLDRFGFDNAKDATLYGIELGWYKNLGFLTSWLDPFTFSGNYTYIKSKVTLTPEQKAKYVTQDRGLQGLSPYVINLMLSYDIKEKRSINLSYNKMAKRLMRVALKNGDVVLGLDDYEIPPHLLDFTWIEKFKYHDTKLDLTFKIRNLLDSETKWVQGSQTTLRYKKGRSYSLSLSAKF